MDYSLSRLRHYSGTGAEHFQRFVLFTNYQRYVDEFVDYGRSEVAEGSEFRSFVEPGGLVRNNPRPDRSSRPTAHRRPNCRRCPPITS